MGKTVPAGIITIGGSDSSGGAGVLADNRILGVRGLYPFTVITAVTSQNDDTFYGMQLVDPALITSQIRSIYEGYGSFIRGIKISFLPGLEIAQAVADSIGDIKKTHPDILVMLDPIITTSSGREIISPDTLDFIRAELLGLVDCITPNYGEANILFPGLKNVVFDETRNGDISKKMIQALGKYTGDVALTGVPLEDKIVDVCISQKSTYIIEDFGTKSSKPVDVLRSKTPRASYATINNTEDFGTKSSKLVDRCSKTSKSSHKPLLTIIQGNDTQYKGFHGTGCFYSSCLLASLVKGEGLEAGMKSAKSALETVLEINETAPKPYYFFPAMGGRNG